MSETARNLMRQAQQMKDSGRLDQAATLYARAVAADPASGIAEHNLAGVLGDLGRWAEAESHIAAALRKGLDAPETWLVRGRALQARGQLDAAETAFREALKRRPDYSDAHRDLAQQIWMRTGDRTAMLATLGRAILASPANVGLRVAQAQALDGAGDAEAAWAAVAPFAQAGSQLGTYASQLALKAGRVREALAIATSNSQAAAEPRALVALADAQLASGMAQEAQATAEALLARKPHDQHAIAILATAWRLLGDERYGLLYDYASLVRAYEIAVPDGWSRLADYLADLKTALKQSHDYQAHPFGQSLRKGSQSVDILFNSDPALHGIRQALDTPIREHLRMLGGGDDPVRSRNVGGYDIQGLWSVQLHGGGYHVDHVHSEGWLSSACYVETVEPRGQEGWIRFGMPGTPTSPALSPEHFIEPKPGMLVLFPSYMWHGTVPFSGEQKRLTFAFDLTPKAG